MSKLVDEGRRIDFAFVAQCDHRIVVGVICIVYFGCTYCEEFARRGFLLVAPVDPTFTGNSPHVDMYVPGLGVAGAGVCTCRGFKILEWTTGAAIAVCKLFPRPCHGPGFNCEF